MTIKLLNEDALDFLQGVESNAVDLVLTDPPYAISKPTNFNSGEATGKDTDRFRVSYEFGEWDVVDTEYFKDVFSETYRVMRSGATLICFYDIWKLESLKTLLESIGFRMFRFIEWVKTNPVPINSKVSYLTNAREVAIVCVKGSKPTYNTSYHNGIFQYPIYQGKDRFHTTQKSLQLFEELISLHSNKGDVVSYCFKGYKNASEVVKDKNSEVLRLREKISNLEDVIDCIQSEIEHVLSGGDFTYGKEDLGI